MSYAFSPRTIILAVATLLVLAVTLWLPPVSQPLDYHGFADSRDWLGIPNAADVLSNLPFLLVGIYGLWRLWWRGAAALSCHYRAEQWAMGIAAAGIAAVAFGSAYYHWQPDNHTLVWDRLPMTIAFMAIFSLVVMERLGHAIGRWVLLVSLPLGLASVAYWAAVDDLRPYLLVQFYPMLVTRFCSGCIPRAIAMRGY